VVVVAAVVAAAAASNHHANFGPAHASVSSRSCFSVLQGDLKGGLPDLAPETALQILLWNIHCMFGLPQPCQSIGTRLASAFTSSGARLTGRGRIYGRSHSRTPI